MENVRNRESDFSTERLPLACFLHADGQLKFIACEPTGNGKVTFVFSDPQHIGDELEFGYERGAVISASALFASQKFLRRQMSIGERRYGRHDHQQ